GMTASIAEHEVSGNPALTMNVAHASGNAAFTTSCRSCGSAIVRPFFASRFAAMLLSLKLSHPVRQLTYRISSESYPGSQGCVVSYYGAERLCRPSCNESPVSHQALHGQTLPLHPGVEHPEDEVKNPLIAQFALWAALGHREVRQDKCLELRFGELDGNRRRCRLWGYGTHQVMASCEEG